MPTFSNGLYLHWSQYTAPAVPHTAFATRTPATAYPRQYETHKGTLAQAWLFNQNRAIRGGMVAAGPNSLSGLAYESSAPAVRHIVLMTQPPRSVIVSEYKTTVDDGAFSFTDIPPGNYMVIDSMTDNSRQALVYDWVVVA